MNIQNTDLSETWKLKLEKKSNALKNLHYKNTKIKKNNSDFDEKIKQLEIQLINISKQMSIEKETRITTEMTSKSKILELEFELKNYKSISNSTEKG